MNIFKVTSLLSLIDRSVYAQDKCVYMTHLTGACAHRYKHIKLKVVYTKSGKYKNTVISLKV